MCAQLATNFPHNNTYSTLKTTIRHEIFHFEPKLKHGRFGKEYNLKT
jgi:hypothetical protein